MSRSKMRTAERKNDPQNKGAGPRYPLHLESRQRYARRIEPDSTETGSDLRVNETPRSGKLPKWLLWSLITIVLWGTWGLVSKVASAGMDAYVNQLLYTAGLAPLLIFVAWTVHRHGTHDAQEGRTIGVFWAF